MALRSKIAWTFVLLQVFFVVVFALFVRYTPEMDPRRGGKTDTLSKDYPMFQDISNMVFLGIGLLYAYLRRYGYSGLGLNFLLCIFCVEWGILTQGWWKLRDGKIDLTLESLYRGAFASASAVIAMGAIFGKTGVMQLLTFCAINVLAYSIENHLRQAYLMATDGAESVALHLFSAVFGCSASFVLDWKAYKQGNPSETHSYDSNIFSLLGTILLWVYWPSFNALGLYGDSQYRSVANTFLSLVGSGITCFAISALVDKDGKFNMTHIQNAALAGAVGVSSTSNLMIQPFGAVAIGSLSGCLCVAGFKYFTPFLAKLGVHDVCGINSLHGLPGVFAGILGVVCLSFANESVYSYSLYLLYPAMAPRANTAALFRIQNSTDLPIGPGLGRSARDQALYQFIYVVAIIVSGCVTGLVTGGILRLKILDPPRNEDMFLDDILWDLSDVHLCEVKKKASEEKTNPAPVSQKA